MSQEHLSMLRRLHKLARRDSGIATIQGGVATIQHPRLDVLRPVSSSRQAYSSSARHAQALGEDTHWLHVCVHARMRN